MTGILLVSYIALWVLFLVVGIVLVSVLRNLGIIYSSLAALAPQQRPLSMLKLGQAVPEAAWETLTGERRTVSDFRGVKQAVTLVSPTCSPCVDHLRSIADRGSEPDPTDSSARHLVSVCLGSLTETLGLLEKATLEADSLPGNVTILMDPQRNTAKKWGMPATPTTVIIDEDLKLVRQFSSAGDTMSSVSGVSA